MFEANSDSPLVLLTEAAGQSVSRAKTSITRFWSVLDGRPTSKCSWDTGQGAEIAIDMAVSIPAPLLRHVGSSG
jgi:hypothetical protein